MPTTPFILEFWLADRDMCLSELIHGHTKKQAIDNGKKILLRKYPGHKIILERIRKA